MNWTMKRLHEIINKPDKECDGCEIHLKRCWEGNNAKSIFTITGLDVAHLLNKDTRTHPPIFFTDCYNIIP